MTDHILRILKKTGPMISSELAKQVSAIGNRSAGYEFLLAIVANSCDPDI